MDVASPRPPRPQRDAQRPTFREPGPSPSAADRLRRLLGWTAGIGTHLLFGVTVWGLFWFLKAGKPPVANPLAKGDLAFDAGLALMFAVPHSLLLWPPVKKHLGRWIRPHFYGLFYAVVTCLSLLVLFAFWRGVEPSAWHLEGITGACVTACFYGSWIALLYSLSLTGLGYQTGLTPWLFWVRREPLPRRDFTPRSVYRWMRHPVYLSFLGLIWFTPHMTADHAMLTGIWTCYIFLGSWLKDERLAYYLGDSYRVYEARVTGYPIVGIGPLARRRQFAALASSPAPSLRGAAHSTRAA